MKSYTDIEQSKKLAEILSTESADMLHCLSFDGDLLATVPKQYSGSFRNQPELTIPCWSLTSLLEQLDDEITDEDGNDYHLTIVKESLQYQLYYHDSWGQAGDIETNYYDDLVDACVDMIIKLHEQKLL